MGAIPRLMKLDYKHIRHAQPEQSKAKFPLKIPAIVVGILGGVVCLSILFSTSPTEAHTTSSAPLGLMSTQNEPLDIPFKAEPESIDLPLPSLSNKIQRDIAPQVSIEPQWKEMTVQRGDTFGQLAYEHGINSSEVRRLLNSKPEFKKVTRIRPGEVIKFRASEDGKLLALQFNLDEINQITAKRKEDGSFEGGKTEHTFDVRENRASGIIGNSFYGSALQAGISDNVIMQMADIFGYDIDFTLDIRKGDRFNVIWSEYHKDGAKIKDGDILAAEFINNGRVIRVVRYTDDEGRSDYFTPKGKSLKKAFIRNPVHFTRISSKFNLARVHPLFKTARPHRGVDYAAKTGTPIFAAGDGKVIFRGIKRGYGNVVIIRHSGNKFTTLYAHMSKFNSKAKLNSYVKQGQTIGYVGKTGWATGPHLHYEFRVNGVHKNPLTIKLPTAEPINQKYMASFKKEANNLTQQLEVMDRTMLAQTQPNSTL